MPDLTPYALHFLGGFHIGTRGVNLEEAGISIPSDTLFAALLDCLSRTGADLDEFIRGYQTDPPFLLTSAFPYVGKLRFYPMPVDSARLFGPQKTVQYGKRLGRIRYLSEGLLKEALSSGRLEDWLFPEDEDDEPQKGVTLQEHNLWLKVEEIPQLPKAFQYREGRRHAMPRLDVWKTDQVPHVTLDRITSASNIFHAGRMEFEDECGLWFGVQWRRPQADFSGKKFQAAFEKGFHILSEDGLGGERSTGQGAFSYRQMETASLPDAKSGQLAYLLSRFHPTSLEAQAALADPKSAYKLSAVSGWLRSFGSPAQRRQRLFLVESGSLIRAGEGILGDLVDVRPRYDGKLAVPHPVYRLGLALAAGWSAGGGDHA